MKRASSSGTGRSRKQRRRAEQQEEEEQEEEGDEVFVQMLADAGCTLLGRDAPLVGCASRLQMQLERSLASDAALRQRFLAGLQLHIQDLDGLSMRRLLKPMSNASESVARVLLTVSPVQPQVATLFLDELPHHFGSNDNLPWMILNQFRWLDYVVDSAAIIQKLVGIVSVAPINLKKDIISFLPELVSDSEHQMVLTLLEQMLREHSELVVPVLDAFSKLSLGRGSCDQVIDVALRSLTYADPDDLPFVVTFLLQSASSNNARRIVQVLRNSLDTLCVPDMRATKRDHKLKASARNSGAFVLDALRSGFRFSDVVYDACLKEVKGLQGETNHKVVDVWMLLLLHANGGPQQKAADALLKRKVINGDISPVLLGQCIQGHALSLQDFFRSVLSLGEFMLRSREWLCLQCGMKLYVLLFQEFHGTYYRQEVVGCLLMHTSSGRSDEVGSALSALLELVETRAHDVLPLSSLIHVLMDYLERFSTGNLHQVYKVFSLLAMKSWTEGSPAADELQLIIRKQVANPDVRYKHMGIVGVINLISCLDIANAELNGPAKEVVDLLQTSVEMCKTSWVALGFLHDELALHLETGTTHGFVLEWAAKHTTEFQVTFLGDLEDGHVSTCNAVSGVLEGELWMNLDGKDSPVYVNVLTMLATHDQSISNSLLVLPASFRLLAATERSLNKGSLASIDALLGCPIYLPKTTLFSEGAWKELPKRQKELACTSLYYAANWIRELISTFSDHLGMSQAPLDDDVATKLFCRLRHLLTVEHLVFSCLEAVPNLVFPQLRYVYEASDSDKKLSEGPQNLRLDTGDGAEGPRLSSDIFGSQQWKLRALSLSSLNLLSTCQDSPEKLPMCLYLMHNLLCKLECSKAASLTGLNALLPSIRRHLDNSVAILKESEPSSSWSERVGSLSVSFSKRGTARLFLSVTFRCLAKILQLRGLIAEDLFAAIGPEKDTAGLVSGASDRSTFDYFEGLMGAAIGASLVVAAELVDLLQSLVNFLKPSCDENALSYMSEELSLLAKGLLDHAWHDEPDKFWKGKHDVLQQLLRVRIFRCASPFECIEDISRAMTQIGASAYPSLSPSTLVIYYRVQHEVVLGLFNNLVVEIVAFNRSKAADCGRAEKLLHSACECVTAHVSLVLLTKTLDHEQTSVCAVALRYGGKFLDAFLKALQFMEAYYEAHEGTVNTMVKQMQKSTRTIQSICSDAKGKRKMPVTCRVPAVKRSLERYVFQIKSLLHKASGGTSFWMGNLKHKDLQGNEVGSQIPVSGDEEDDTI